MKNKDFIPNQLLSMRMDKFLKVACLTKRRVVAQDLCKTDRVVINGRTAKPSSNVKVGDIITLVRSYGTLTLRIEKLSKVVRKNMASSLYTVLEENIYDKSDKFSNYFANTSKEASSDALADESTLFWFDAPFTDFSSLEESEDIFDNKLVKEENL